MSNASFYQRILVVEDEPLLRWSIRETVLGAGHVVVAAPDAATAMREVREACEPFDVVLVSHPLPDQDSFAILAHLRRWSPTTAVVFMPVFANRDDIGKARQLGAVGVLRKPFDMHVLHRAVVDAAGI